MRNREKQRILSLFVVTCTLCTSLFGCAAAKKIEVVTVSSVSLSYNPNQVYLSGEVASDSYQVETYDKEKKIFDILVSEGDTVQEGTPLYQYDASLDAINLELKKSQIESLKYDIEENRKLYKQYAKKDYESLIPTATPVETPQPTAELSEEGQKGTDQKTKILSALTDLRKLSVVRFDVSDISEDSFPQYYGKELANHFNSSKKEKIEDSCTFYDDNGNSISYEIELNFSNPTSKTFEGYNYSWNDYSLTKVQQNQFNGINFIKDDGTVFKIPGLSKSFFKKYVLLSYNDNVNYTIVLYETQNSQQFLTIAFTKLPGSTPEPEEEEEESLTKEERLEKAEEYAKKIREAEIEQKQLMVDVQKLEQQGVDGYIRSKIDGTVTSVKNPDELSDGQSMITIRGDEGFYVRCSASEINLDQLKPGTTLNGFIYETGINCTGVVTSIDTVPTGTSETQYYSESVSSSQYPVRIQIEDGDQIKAGQYIEFTIDDTAGLSSNLYIYEPYVRKENGESFVFIVRDGRLKKEVVKTGMLYFNYVEILNSDITTDDYIAFPYEQNAVNGASPVYAN